MTDQELASLDLSKFTIDKLAEWHILFRDKLKKMDEDLKAQKKPLEAFKARLEGHFEAFLMTNNLKNAVTKGGTVHWNTRCTASLTDPEEFMGYVIENRAWSLLDRRANATVVQDFVTREGSLPPGVKLNTYRTVGVNRPGVKAKEE